MITFSIDWSHRSPSDLSTGGEYNRRNCRFTFARTLLVNYEQHAAFFDQVVVTPAFIGELAMVLWLLIKGVRVPRT
jgi:hypothetical protein